jgi:hypothetical protein
MTLVEVARDARTGLGTVPLRPDWRDPHQAENALESQQLRAALQHNELRGQLVQHVGGGLGWKAPNGHAVQAEPVIGYTRSHAPDLLLGSLDLMMTGH